MIDGKAVRRLREQRGESLRVLAARVSDLSGRTVSAQALERVEAEEYDLSVERTAALAAALGVGISDILLPFESAVA